MVYIKQQTSGLGAPHCNLLVDFKCLRCLLSACGQQFDDALCQWCPKTKRLIPNNQKALSIQEVIKNVEGIPRLLQEPATIVRFHALKKPEGATGPIPWLWMVSTQHNPEIYHCLKEISWHAAWPTNPELQPA